MSRKKLDFKGNKLEMIKRSYCPLLMFMFAWNSSADGRLGEDFVKESYFVYITNKFGKKKVKHDLWCPMASPA